MDNDELFNDIIQKALQEAAGVPADREEYELALRDWVEQILMEIG